MHGYLPFETLTAAAEKAPNKCKAGPDRKTVDPRAIVSDLNSMSSGPATGPVGVCLGRTTRPDPWDTNPLTVK